jgi:hypothetical protein
VVFADDALQELVSIQSELDDLLHDSLIRSTEDETREFFRLSNTVYYREKSTGTWNVGPNGLHHGWKPADDSFVPFLEIARTRLIAREKSMEAEAGVASATGDVLPDSPLIRSLPFPRSDGGDDKSGQGSDGLEVFADESEPSFPTPMPGVRVSPVGSEDRAFQGSENGGVPSGDPSDVSGAGPDGASVPLDWDEDEDVVSDEIDVSDDENSRKHSDTTSGIFMRSLDRTDFDDVDD